MKRLERLFLISFCIFLSSCAIPFKEDDDHQIVQVEDFYPIRYVEAEKGKQIPDDMANVIDLNKINKCRQERALLSPKSLGISKLEFDQLWSSLRKGQSQGKQYIFTYGECDVDGPWIKKIENCTAEKCGEGSVVDESLLWIGTWAWSGDVELPRSTLREYTISRKDIASFFVKTPLAYDNQKQAWKFKMMYASKPTMVALEGYMNAEDFTKGNFVQEIRGYDPEGNLLFISAYDDNGKRSGNYTGYYPSGKIELLGVFKNDELVGNYIRYSESGQVIKN